MARWTIYGKDGNPKAITTGVTVGSRTLPELEYSGTWMGECFVTVTAKSEQPINWQLGDYMLYRGEKFVLNYDPSVIKQARANTYGEAFVYDNVKFNSLAVELTDVQFLDVVLSDNKIHYTSLPAFSFFANDIEDLADRLQANCNRYCRQNGFAISDWWIILTPSLTRTVARGRASGETADEKTAFENLFRNAWNANYSSQDNNETGKLNQNVSVSNQSISQALALIKSTFDLNFVNKGRQVIIGAPARIVGHEFAYGRGNGLHQIERVVDSEQQVITKLIAYGGSTNLPIRYYADINKVCFADVLSIEQGVAKLDVLFSRDRFNGYQDQIVPYPLYKVLFHVDGGQKEGYVSDHINQDTAGDGSCYLISSSLDVGDRIYFDSGVVVDKWPSGHFSYINEGKILPDNLAVNNLMLPGFPTQSLYDWVIANNGIAVQDGRNNSKYGRATWTYNNVTYDAFFSKDKLNPYILSLNYDSVGIREYTKFFDGSDETEDIYPTIENTGADHLVSADVIEDNGVFEEGSTVPDFHITIPSLGQNVEFNSLIKEDTTISMKDGYCGGREFKVVSASKNNNGSWDVTLQREPDDALQLYFPYSDKASRGETAIANEAYQLRGSDISGYAGDKFVIIAIDMPATYVEESAKKLLSLALEYLFANQYVRYTYVPKVDEIFMAREHDAATALTSLHDTLKEGDLMQFEDDDLSIEGNIFIDTLHIKEYGNNGIPTYDVTLKETKTVGTIERIKQQIDNLKVGVGVTYGSATGGLSTSQVKTLISSEGDKRYIRRDVNDETNTSLTANEFVAKNGVKTDTIVAKTENGAVTVNAPLTSNGAFTAETIAEIKESLEMGDNEYIPNQSGCKIYHNGSGWMIETDYLSVNKKMYAKSIQVDEVEHVGGENLLTDASCIADEVLWYNSNNRKTTVRSDVAYFRVFFRKKNGEGRTIYNRFRKGDQAYCQIFNIDKGTTSDFTNRYYWRLVVRTSNENGTYDEYTTPLLADYHFIDLSASDCDGADVMLAGVDATDVPQPEDPIVQLGYRRQSGDDDATVTERQGATLISGGGKYRRSLLMWEGIGSGERNPVQTIPQKYYYMPSPRVKLSPHDVRLIVDSFYIRTGGQDKTVTEYMGIYAVECSTVLVSTNSINNAQPVVLGAQTNSTLYAVQFGDYLLKMGEEEEGSSAVITCKPILQHQESKEYLTTGTLTAYNVKGNEIISTIGYSSSGELTFAYTDIDLNCDVVRVVYTIDGTEMARSNISVVVDGVNAQFHELQDNGCYARIAFTDTIDEGSSTSTAMSLRLYCNALVNIVDGDDKYPVDDLTGYTLVGRLSYDGNTLTRNVGVTTVAGGTDYFYANLTETVLPSKIGTLSKNVSLVLKKDDIELAVVQIPVTMEESSVYSRTNTMMQSLYASGGYVSTIKQTADNVALAVGKLGDGLEQTGIDIQHKKITLTSNQLLCKNNAGDSTMWIDSEGNLTVVGSYNNFITEINSGNSNKYTTWTDDYGYIRCGLDLLRCGNVIKIKSLPSASFDDGATNKIIRLPYFISSTNSYQIKTNNLRTENDVAHMMTADEMRQLVGKKVDIIFDLPSTPSQRYFLGGIHSYVPNDISEGASLSTLGYAVRSIANGQNIVKREADIFSADFEIHPKMTVHLECKSLWVINGVLDNVGGSSVYNYYAYIWSAATSYATSDKRELIDNFWI